MKPMEGRGRRPSESRHASDSETGPSSWQERPIGRAVRRDRPARMDRNIRSSGMKSLVVGIIACVYMWGALDRDCCGGGRPLLSLLVPVADAHDLDDDYWDPNGLSGDTSPGNDVAAHVHAQQATAANPPQQATPRNRGSSYRAYVDDDDSISEEDIWYDDDYVSGDATYTNEHVAGEAAFHRGENDCGAGPSIVDSNYRGVPSPRPTRNPTPTPPTPRPTRRPRPRPTPSPTKSHTLEPTESHTLEPTEDAPVPKPTDPPVDGSSVQGSTPPPIPYTFTIQMTPFEITLTSMDDELDGQQLQLFNLFSDKEIEQTWLSRKLENLSEDDVTSLADGYVDISFKTVVTSQLLSAPLVASSPTVDVSPESSSNSNAAAGEEIYRRSGGGDRSPKSPKGAQTPTAAPTVDLDDLVRGRRRMEITDRRERQRQGQSQRNRTLNNNNNNNNKADDDIDHTSLSQSSITPAVEHTLYLQQTKTAYITLRGEYLLHSQPEIIPTLSDLDTAVQITYGSKSPDLVTVLQDYDLDAFDELHGIDFLHFFYPSTVGSVSSIIGGEQMPTQQGKSLSGGAKFGIFLATAVGAALLGLAVVRRGSGDDNNEPKSSSSKKASRYVLCFYSHHRLHTSIYSHRRLHTSILSSPSINSFNSFHLFSFFLQQ